MVWGMMEESARRAHLCRQGNATHFMQSERQPLRRGVEFVAQRNVWRGWGVWVMGLYSGDTSPPCIAVRTTRTFIHGYQNIPPVGTGSFPT